MQPMPMPAGAMLYDPRKQLVKLRDRAKLLTDFSVSAGVVIGKAFPDVPVDDVTQFSQLLAALLVDPIKDHMEALEAATQQVGIPESVLMGWIEERDGLARAMKQITDMFEGLSTDEDDVMDSVIRRIFPFMQSLVEPQRRRLEQLDQQIRMAQRQMDGAAQLSMLEDSEKWMLACATCGDVLVSAMGTDPEDFDAPDYGGADPSGVEAITRFRAEHLGHDVAAMSVAGLSQKQVSE